MLITRLRLRQISYLSESDYRWPPETSWVRGSEASPFDFDKQQFFFVASRCSPPCPKSKIKANSSVATPRLSGNPSAVELYDVQLVAQFWQRWAPVTNSSPGEWNHTWLQQAISAQKSTETLDLSIKALAFTRLGWLQHDTALATRGSMLYGRALRELQRSLWDEPTMWLDETLAAAYALSVYEVSHSQAIHVCRLLNHCSSLRIRLAPSKAGIHISRV